MAYQRSVGELTVIFIVFTLCLCFLGWIGTALVRWHNEPYTAPKPTSLEQAISACKDRGGIPYTDYKEVNSYTEEYLSKCEEKPAQ